MKLDRTLKFVDLFSGMGGIRKGFELACKDKNISSECVFASEIKPAAVNVIRQNNPGEYVHGDITKIVAAQIPNFDILLAGFPCQAFSSAGKRQGFNDTRGTLFFDVMRILREKRPLGFVLENVEGLVNHDKEQSNDKIGRTLKIIINNLVCAGYNIAWKVLNAKDFGVPQDRKRIYILGTLTKKPDIENFEKKYSVLGDVLEKGLPVSKSNFVKLILSHYPLNKLPGKSIKDKRGGDNNIHSWDIEYKGSVTEKEKKLLNLMLKERRKKKWAEDYGIDWMDGMPLTIEQIRTFFDDDNLEYMLQDLTTKKYLKLEYPKKKIGNKRVYDTNQPLGYNIVAGKISYEVSKILNPQEIAPTLVAMDMNRLFVPDLGGIRPLSLKEGLRLFGYPDDYKFDVSLQDGYDLLGNTVVVPVIREVSKRIIDVYLKGVA